MDKIRKLRLFQARHYISLDYTRQDVSIFSLDTPAESAIPMISSRRLAPPHEEPLKLELAAFLDAVRNRQAVECGGEEAIGALNLALQVRDKAEKAQAQEFDRR